jgi:pyruvate,water dikinase
MKSYIKKFSEIGIEDIPEVGGKNASLGEMLSGLSSAGIRVPDGFATTTFAFEEFLTHNQLHQPLRDLMSMLNKKDFSNLREIGSKARALMLSAQIPKKIQAAIVQSYAELVGEDLSEVAVRSSATAEDLPDASFAGQHESYLNIRGENALLVAVKKCFASLYTDRAIKYREDNRFLHQAVSISVGIQKMVRADKSCSGVCFTLEPESGFRNIIHVSGVWGLGENIVQGTVTPDEFFVFKPTLQQGKNAIVQKRLGEKAKTMIYNHSDQKPVVNISTPIALRKIFVLTDDEVTTIANWALTIEQHYQKPMDIEWAKDGITNELFIIQARPETVHSRQNPLLVTEYHISNKGKILAQGNAVGEKIASGIARILQSPKDSDKLKAGEIVVTDVTSPDWDPILKNAAAIITNKGGRTSHASIVARELGVPAIVGCDNATSTIHDGDIITVSCCEGKTGFIYEGKVDFTTSNYDFEKIRKPETVEVMLIAADPDKAFQLSFYPNSGVGLMRLEFIITHSVQIHPWHWCGLMN